MDKYQFTASVISSLAWPLSLLVMGLVFRKPIIDVIKRINKASFAGAEVEISEGITKAELEIGSPPKRLLPPEQNSIIDRLHDLADTSPRAAIIESWIMIEHQLHKLYREIHPTTKAMLSPMRLLDKMREEKLIEDSLFYALSEMRIVRNKATHFPDFAITRESCDRYLNLVNEFMSMYAGD